LRNSSFASEFYIFPHFRLEKERVRQDELTKEIQMLKEKLERANEGLSAASRLNKQLENKSQV
jgi:hypothetical protein